MILIVNYRVNSQKILQSNTFCCLLVYTKTQEYLHVYIQVSIVISMTNTAFRTEFVLIFANVYGDTPYLRHLTFQHPGEMNLTWISLSNNLIGGYDLSTVMSISVSQFFV